MMKIDKERKLRKDKQREFNERILVLIEDIYNHADISYVKLEIAILKDFLENE